MLKISRSIAMAALLLALPGVASAANSQMRRTVASELATYNMKIKVSELTDTQVVQIYRILYSGHGTGMKQSQIRAAVGDCLPLLCRIGRSR